LETEDEIRRDSGNVKQRLITQFSQRKLFTTFVINFKTAVRFSFLPGSCVQLNEFRYVTGHCELALILHRRITLISARVNPKVETDEAENSR